MTHTEAATNFDRCRNKTTGYLLAKHTRLQKRGRAFAVRYYDTDIVLIRPDGKYRLNSGRWRTITTKNRMNSILPGRGIGLTQGIWHIRDQVYIDGMLVEENGNILKKTKPLSDALSIRRKVDNKCRKFIDLVVTASLGQDIGIWNDNTTHAPIITSREMHITRLWQAVSEAEEMISTDSHKFCNTWIRKAIASSNSPKSNFIWTTMRDNLLLRRRSYLIEDSLRSLLRKAKPMIVDQIMFGDQKA